MELVRYRGRIVVRAVDRTICKRPVLVGDVLMAIGYETMKLIDNDVGFGQVLSVLKTAPRPLYLGFVRGSLGAKGTSLV